MSARWHSRWPVIAVCFGLLFIALPAERTLVDPCFFQSHDGFEHLFRTLAVETSLRRGGLIPAWVPQLAGGFGYPLFAVYSPAAYVLPALLGLAGIPLPEALKLNIALLCLLAAIGAYLAVRPLAGRSGGLVAAAAYASAPYTLANAYVRLDLAELTTFPLTAFTVAGLLELGRRLTADDPTTKGRLDIGVVLVALPLALIPLAHSLSLFTFMPTLLVVLATVMRDLMPRGRATMRALAILAAPCLLAAALAAWFIVPAAQWQGWVRLSTMPGDSHFIPKLVDLPTALAALVRGPRAGWFAGAAWWYASLAPSASGELPVAPAYITVIVAVAAIVFAVARRSPRRALALALGAAACITAWFLTRWSLSFWLAFPRLTQLQFPWRLVGPLSLDVALLSGLLIAELPTRARALVAACLIAAMVVPALWFVHPRDHVLDPTGISWPGQLRRELQGGFGTTGSGLFLPIWVGTAVPTAAVPRAASATRRNRLVIRALRLNGHTLVLDYDDPAVQTLTLARLYIPAWHATLDRRPVALQPQPRTGLQTVRLPSGRHQLRVMLRPTWLTLLADALSLGAAVLVAALLLRPLLAMLHRLQRAMRLVLVPSSRFPPPISRQPGARGAGVPSLDPRPIVAALAWLLLLAFFSLRATHPPNAPRWNLPATAAAPQLPISVVAWRLDRQPDWGSPATLRVVYLSRQWIGDDDDVVVRLLDPRDGLAAVTRTRPRSGSLTTTGWPAGLLTDDHLTLPGPANLCPGPYRVAIGFAPHGATTFPTFQELGSIDASWPASSGCAPLTPEPATGPLATIRATGLSADAHMLPELIPGELLRVSLRIATRRPTVGDGALTVALLDTTGHPLVQHHSYGNLDLIFTSLWRPGGHVRYDAELPVPHDAPPGLYRLAAGVYVPGGGDVAVASSPGAGRVGRLVVLGRYKVPAPLSGTAPLLATFGGKFGLTRATIGAEPGTPVLPEARVPVTLRWRALAPTSSNETVFVQLLDPAGRLVAQADGQPMDGRYPTSAWGVGEAITDRHNLQIPATLPPGRYHVVVGWYLLATGQRLRVIPSHPAEAVDVGTLDVAR